MTDSETGDPLPQDDTAFDVFRKPRTRAPRRRTADPTASSGTAGGQEQPANLRSVPKDPEPEEPPRPQAAPPQPAEAAAASHPAAEAAAPEPAAQIAPPRPAAPVAPPPAAQAAPAADDANEVFSPTSVLIDREVWRKFEFYKSRFRPEPRNTAVLIDALNHCYGQYAELIAKKRRPTQETAGLPFPNVVSRRRATDGRRLTEQLALRPTAAELAKIKEMAADAKARSVSEFVEAVLDKFLDDHGLKVPRGFTPKRRA